MNIESGFGFVVLKISKNEEVYKRKEQYCCCSEMQT